MKIYFWFAAFVLAGVLAIGYSLSAISPVNATPDWDSVYPSEAR